MRIIGVDPGDARIGLAISDPAGTLARPLVIVEHEARAQDAARIAALAAEQEAEHIVVGHPLDAEGRPTPQSRKAKRLAAAIREASGLPVDLWDESGSSQAAHEARVGRGVGRAARLSPVDAEAAAVILQDYLDHKKEARDG
ncbi:MAG: Holliday junction resolvase RuvX [Chloroflexi bacterium]|nr:Holliday junction resolvase RuvX [Chloroflexota bacterium]MQC27059.1 Holliday junction resolvase RuvX [Chloroflexota bacterium]